MEESCCLVLKCSSPDEGVALSWQTQHPNVIAGNIQGPKTTFLLAIINTKQYGISISCTATSDMENATSVITKDCGGKITMSQRKVSALYISNETQLSSSSSYI